MLEHEILAQLQATLIDRKLTSSEKKTLKEAFAPLTPHERALARHLAFDLARQHVLQGNPVEVLDWLEGVLKALQPAQEEESPDRAYFSPDHNCPSAIIQLFREVKHSVDICVFTITDDRLADAVLEAHNRGVAIRVMSDDEKMHDPGSDIPQFIRARIPVRLDPATIQRAAHMHHKFAIFDGELLLSGSYNWTRGAAEQNKENFIVTSNRRLVAAFQQAFDKLWAEFEPQRR